MALFRYGLQVIQALPLRLGVQSKAERARRLLSREAPALVRAVPPSLTPESPLDEAIGALMHNCMNQFLGNLPALASGDGVEAVHQMRVAMRRLRSALGLFNRAFPCAEFQDLRAEFERIAAVLGEARDWDVFVETLRARPLPRFADEPGFDRLLSAAEAKAAAGRAAVLDLVGDKTTTRFALVVERIAAGRGWRRSATGDRLRRLSEPVVGFAASSLDRLDRKVRRRGRHFRSLSSEKRHALRISLKDLRYATEFFWRSLSPGVSGGGYADKAKALQDFFSAKLNDAAIAQRLIKDLTEVRARICPLWQASRRAGAPARASATRCRWRRRGVRWSKRQRYWRSELADRKPELD